MPCLFPPVPTISSISSVGPSPGTRKLFLWLSVWDDELLSTAKITTFLAKWLPKLHVPAPSNGISYSL